MPDRDVLPDQGASGPIRWATPHPSGDDTITVVVADAYDRLRAENERLRKVLERIAYPADFLQSRGQLSSLARRELRGASDEDGAS